MGNDDVADQIPFALSDTIALLARTPATLNAWLRGLPSHWLNATEGDDTWSAVSVVGHLVVGEKTDWMVRAKRILEHGESVAFDPFDRFAQKAWQERSIEELLDEFSRLRAENLVALQGLDLQPTDLAKTGRHLRLGTVTLAQLLATWAAHDLTHMHQISRILAHQYLTAVGPWKVFLGVLQCNGHSEP